MNWEFLREVRNCLRRREVDSKIESSGKNCCVYQSEYLTQNFGTYYLCAFHRSFRTECYEGLWRVLKSVHFFSYLVFYILFPFMILRRDIRISALLKSLIGLYNLTLTSSPLLLLNTRMFNKIPTVMKIFSAAQKHLLHSLLSWCDLSKQRCCNK